jgi:hypothetical protein
MYLQERMNTRIAACKLGLKLTCAMASLTSVSRSASSIRSSSDKALEFNGGMVYF